MLTVEFSTKCIESAGELIAKGEDLLPRLAELPSTLENLSRRSSRLGDVHGTILYSHIDNTPAILSI